MTLCDESPVGSLLRERANGTQRTSRPLIQVHPRWFPLGRTSCCYRIGPLHVL